MSYKASSTYTSGSPDCTDEDGHCLQATSQLLFTSFSAPADKHLKKLKGRQICVEDGSAHFGDSWGNTPGRYSQKDSRLTNAQVVISVVDHDHRPEIEENGEFPGGVPAAYQKYLNLMKQCWATKPTNRPTYEGIIGHMR